MVVVLRRGNQEPARESRDDSNHSPCSSYPFQVLVPISEHINRLIATRLQFDIMGVCNLIVARTDAEAATLLSSNIDKRDHAFILGSTNPNLPPLVEAMDTARLQGKSGSELQAVEDKWIDDAGLMLYSEAVVKAIKATGGAKAADLEKTWLDKVASKGAEVSYYEASKVAASLGVASVVHWDWDAPRTREGYYRYQGEGKRSGFIWQYYTHVTLLITHLIHTSNQPPLLSRWYKVLY